jgi:hypothetical protein
VLSARVAALVLVGRTTEASAAANAADAELAHQPGDALAAHPAALAEPELGVLARRAVRLTRPAPAW